MFKNKKKIRKELRVSEGKIKAGSFYFHDIKAYHQKKNKADAFRVLSDQTSNDLDFEEFFMFADRTIPKSVIREASDLAKQKFKN